jgi:predicted O-methyltransferase YrrM
MRTGERRRTSARLAAGGESCGEEMSDSQKHRYKSFFKTYGSAYRTKHIRPLSANPVLRTLGALWAGPSWAVRRNNRPFYLPGGRNLPAEFIRLDPWEGQYVYLIASLAKRGILEIGRFNGGSAFLMACANPDVPIYSLDIAPQNDDLLRDLFRSQRQGANVRLIVGDSQRERSAEVGEFDVLFVDGDHSYDGCTRDLENWFPRLERGGHILLHDAYQGSEVQPSILDFVDRHDVQVIVPPYVPADHWHLPMGSVVHLKKRLAE